MLTLKEFDQQFGCIINEVLSKYYGNQIDHYTLYMIKQELYTQLSSVFSFIKEDDISIDVDNEGALVINSDNLFNRLIVTER